MRRRIAQRLRGIIEGAYKTIMMLEVEKNAINLKTSRGLEDLAVVERVLAKLEDLALTIECELQLRQTAAEHTQTPSALEARVERYFGEVAEDLDA